MRITVAQYIAQYLVDYGIEDMFTLTGGGAMHLNDAFGHQKGLTCIYNHHEQACAIAAESYTRLTGNLAAVCVTSGPGGTNTLTGVLGGWLDSIPMIVISGQVKFTTTIKSTSVPLRQLGDQEFNITDCVKHMTKYAVMVTEPYSIRYHLEKALFLAQQGRPGPVWLDIPLNVQAAQITTEDLEGYDAKEDAQELPPTVSKQTIDVVIEKIRQAKRPVILAGNGIRISKSHTLFLDLIDKLHIPVVTAWNAHDLVPDAHPLYCGRPGTVGTRGGNFVIQKSDLVLSLGCRMNIRQISYNWENFAKNAFLIAVDIDEAELQKPTLEVNLPVHADVKDFMQNLYNAPYEDPKETHAQWLAWCRVIDKKYPAVLPEYYAKKSLTNPYVFMKELSQNLEEGSVTVSSNGSACVCSFQAMIIKSSQRLYTNSGCASMGYGLPAALGAAVARKGKPVVCLEGDGSIQMNIQELQTIIHNNLNVKIFVLNNDGYLSIKQTQTNAFNANYCGINKSSGVSFPSVEKLAYAYGFPYFRISSNDEINPVVEQILSIDSPVLCEVVVDPEQFFAPKLSSKSMPDGSIVSPSLEDMFPFLPAEEMQEIMGSI